MRGPGWVGHVDAGVLLVPPTEADVRAAGTLRERYARVGVFDSVHAGTRERMETHRSRFEGAVGDLERSERSLRDRFDAVIENVDRALAEGT